MGQIPAATSAALPELLPPVWWAGLCGLRAVPVARLSPVVPSPISCSVALPTSSAPASCSASTPPRLRCGVRLQAGQARQHRD